MYHADLRKEISFLQASLQYKRQKLDEALKAKAPFRQLNELSDAIKEIEQKLQICLEESNAQFNNSSEDEKN